MKNNDYGPLFTGEIERDKGITLVTSHNEDWMEQCVFLASQYARQAKEGFTGESIRFCCEKLVGSPQHPNAWGALINTLVRRKIIVPTGEYRKMKDSRSHARKTPVYRAV